MNGIGGGLIALIIILIIALVIIVNCVKIVPAFKIACLSQELLSTPPRLL